MTVPASNRGCRWLVARAAPGLFTLFIAVSPMFASAESPFKAGVAAFQAGEYQQAVTHLERALAERGPSASLLHNLGVAHFRAGHYSEANQTFRLLLDYPGSRDVALYNLGLVALAQDREALARDYFERVTREAESDKLVGLALEQLAIMGEPEVSERPWQAVVSAALGYEDNLNLAADRTIQEQDAFFETLAWGTAYLVGDDALGLRATALINDRVYFSESDLRQTVARPGLALDYQVSDWRHTLSTDFEWSWVGGDRIERRDRLQWTLDRDTDIGRLRSRLDTTRIDAGDEFPELEGEQQSLELSWRRYWTRDWGTRLSYRFENNNRDDLEVGDDFFSVSPRRHAVEGDIYFHPADAWFTRLALQYRRSDYRDADRVDGESMGKREEDRWRMTGTAYYQLSAHWEWFVSAQSEVNRSNRDARDYERFEIMSGFEARF